NLSSFVSPLLCHTPSLTLFPYTTLFRSPERRKLRHVSCFRHFCSRTFPVKRHQQQYRVIGCRCFDWFGLRQYAIDDASSRGQAEDRKSTRLNSSHVKISYAVFCLKKKT